MRPTRAVIDLGAIRHNGEVIGAVAGVPIMAIVKADGYGHGAVPVAKTALAAGAQHLGVALVEEGIELREAGIEAPILVLSEPPRAAAVTLVEHRLTATVYTPEFIEALPAGAVVHLKVDTGMHRVGAAPGDALALARRIQERGLVHEGTWTHLAVSEQENHPATAEQLRRFETVLAGLNQPGLIHAANSGGALGVPAARYDLVRVGIALYGITPAPDYRHDPGLRPAMSLRSEVSFVKPLAAGEAVSYGLTWAPAGATTVATVPVGYADGYPRRLSNRAEATIRGLRVRQVGRVTMDQILLDCGDLPVEPGDEVVLLGDGVTAHELAGHAETIAYEILTGIGRRVPREYVGPSEP